jgi:Protein of unknown function (DUF1064)
MNWVKRGAVSKYGNKPRRCPAGHFHQSGMEASRCSELHALQAAGLISDLEQQPRFRLDVNGVHVCEYRGDFKYTDCETGQSVTEDVKGFATDVYKIKRRLVLAIHGVDIQEVRKVRGVR